MICCIPPLKCIPEGATREERERMFLEYARSLAMANSSATWPRKLKRLLMKQKAIKLGACMFDPKPPVGLKPKHLHGYERAKEIVAAISRYLDAGRQIPHEWLTELDQLEIVEKNMPSLSRQQRPCEPPPRRRCCCENDSK